MGCDVEEGSETILSLPRQSHFQSLSKIPPAWEIKEGDRLYTGDTKTSLARIEPIRLLKAYLNYGDQMKLPLRWTADRSREGGYLLICYFL